MVILSSQKTFFPVFLLIFVFGLLLFSPNQTKAENKETVIINEICWMGTEKSFNDEWIELYNPSGKAILLEGWVLKNSESTIEINLTGEIPTEGFYLLERSDEDTVPEKEADIVYTGTLKNSGENLKLYDNFNNLIDEVSCQDGWFAGDNKTKQTMERTDSGWQNSKKIGGTPKEKNGEHIKETMGKEEKKQEEPRQEALKTYPAGIFFNEILPSPEGPDSEEEWIEIINLNDFSVDVSGWIINDITGKTKSFIIPEKTTIKNKGFLLFRRIETKITLNNSGDGLELFSPDKNLKDSLNYEKAPLGKSLSKNGAVWGWNENLTPGENNMFNSKEEKAPAKETTEPKITAKEKELASIKETFETENKKNNVYPIIIFSIINAFLAGVLILILKKKIKTN